MSLKESSDNYKKIITIFNAFNRQQRELSRIHSFEFSQAKKKMEAAQKEAMSSRNFTNYQNTYKQVNDAFVPITKQIQEREEKLDKDLEPLFSKKQFKKWKKLKEKIKKKG